MKVNNPLYKNQGIHAVTSIFTVEKGIVKVLLIKRTNAPYKDMWALVGGAIYNNEDLIDGAKREIYEKTGIENIDLYFSSVFGDKNRSPVMRMLACSYIGVIDNNKVEILKETMNTSNAEFFDITSLPNLAYDHSDIIKISLENLKKLIVETSILKSLLPSEFVLPELIKVYEIILGKTLDRRNFRKQILNSDLIENTNKMKKFEGKKPAIVYKFKSW